MLHVPILRAGRPYRSLEVAPLRHFRDGNPVAELSLANRGLIARDLLELESQRQALTEMSVRELLEICGKAAREFLEADLQVGDDLQGPDDFVRVQSATTGLPEALCRKNMGKIADVLENIEAVLGGLTRGLDLEVLDSGYSVQEGRVLSYLCQTESLGAVLPSNSPGVHALWVPSIPLKVPVVLKPGSQEPWTPLRIAQAFINSGCPPQAFGFYPSNYAGATEVLLRCGRSLVFGDRSTVAPWVNDPRVQIHGPGWSKVLVGSDMVDRWEDFAELMVGSVAENGGRSCINASGIWLAGRGREIAHGLAKRMARIEALPLDHPAAALAAFPNPKMARQLSLMIDRQIAEGGAEDVTARYRGTERVVEVDGATFLLPTLIYCESPEHPLAQAEYLFPFASVVEVAEDRMAEQLGPTLVASLLTENRDLVQRLLRSRKIERFNVGAIPTYRISWDQPHEGNIFDLLYRQRALQAEAPLAGRIGAAV